jgi:hypothetical protein
LRAIHCFRSFSRAIHCFRSFALIFLHFSLNFARFSLIFAHFSLIFYSFSPFFRLFFPPVLPPSYIAVEIAGIFGALGTESHMFYRRERMLRGFDTETVDFLTVIGGFGGVFGAF